MDSQARAIGWATVMPCDASSSRSGGLHGTRPAPGTPGRPAVYATTKTFLDDLGLRSLAELPPLAELDTSHLLELPDAPAKAAEAELALASPILDTPASASADLAPAGDAERDAPETNPTLH